MKSQLDVVNNPKQQNDKHRFLLDRREQLSKELSELNERNHVGEEIDKLESKMNLQHKESLQQSLSVLDYTIKHHSEKMQTGGKNQPMKDLTNISSRCKRTNKTAGGEQSKNKQKVAKAATDASSSSRSKRTNKTDDKKPAAKPKALRENGEEEEKEAENLVINWGKNSKKRTLAPLMPKANGIGTKSGKRKFISTSCYF